MMQKENRQPQKTNMLLKYRVSNYKSIGHDIEFSMLPTAENTDERYTSKISTRAGDWNVLHRGILFGANASGKSAFMESLAFAKRFITQGQRSGRKIFVNQFKNPIPELEGLTTFQFMLYINGEVYDYGFSLNNDMVQEEWLFILENNGFQGVFERETNKKSHTSIKFDGKKINVKKEFLDMLSETIQIKQKNQLFLYKLYDNGVAGVEDLFEWFDDIQILFPSSEVTGIDRAVAKNKNFAQELSRFLKQFGTGVDDVSTELVALEDFERQYNLPEELIQNMYDVKKGIFKINDKYYIFEVTDGEIQLRKTKFRHSLYGKAYSFDRDEESDGTQRLLDLFPVLYNARSKGSIFFIDEMDRSLHTKLTTKFLQSFLREAKQTMSQLIITAHDVNIMNLNTLSPDEIWFLEKTQNGETEIRPFSDFDVNHKGYNVMRSYLEGRFGAVPRIREDV